MRKALNLSRELFNNKCDDNCSSGITSFLCPENNWRARPFAFPQEKRLIHKGMTV